MANGIVSSTLDGIAALVGKKDSSSKDAMAKRWSEDTEARKQAEKQWQINIAYYMGRQWPDQSLAHWSS